MPVLLKLSANGETPCEPKRVRIIYYDEEDGYEESLKPKNLLPLLLEVANENLPELLIEEE